jgi:RNA polymerase sigma-70 factor (ECF subfamily)
MTVGADNNLDRRKADEAARESSKNKLFLRLFLQNERRLYAYILTLLPHRADADDILQEASLVLWDKFDENNPPDDFAAWGCRIAYYKVLDFLKKDRRSRVCFC